MHMVGPDNSEPRLHVVQGSGEIMPEKEGLIEYWRQVVSGVFRESARETDPAASPDISLVPGSPEQPATATASKKAEGDVYDMDQYRRERAARVEVAAAIEALPPPEISGFEDLFEKRAA